MDFAGAQVLGMISEEGESFKFHEAVTAEGPAEEWMRRVDDAMKNTLQRITKDGVYHYAYKPRYSSATFFQQLQSTGKHRVAA